MMGDDLYVHGDLESLLLYPLSVLAQEIVDPRPMGALVTDARSNLVSVEERVALEGLRLINTGAYVLDENFFDYPLVSIGNDEYGLPQTLAVMTRDYPVRVVRATGWLSVGYPDDLVLAEEFLKKHSPDLHG